MRWPRRRRTEAEDRHLREVGSRVHKTRAEFRKIRRDNHFAAWFKDALEGR